MVENFPSLGQLKDDPASNRLFKGWNEVQPTILILDVEDFRNGNVIYI